MTTKIPVELSSTPGIVDGSNATAITIDSSENVGIGTSSPARKVQIQDTSASVYLAVTSANSNAAGIMFGDTDDETMGRVTYDNTNNSMQFWTNDSQKMLIDSSGNLLVSGTSSSINAGSISLEAQGRIRAGRDGGAVMQLNRTTSDGDIAVFYKDGTTVGSIGTQGGDLNIGTAACGIAFVDGVPAVYPWTTSGNATRDAAIDLGDSGGRFKDLYLSGAAKTVGADFSGQVQHLAGNVSTYFRADNARYGQIFMDNDAFNIKGWTGSAEPIKINAAASGAPILLQSGSTTKIRIDGDGLKFNSDTAADNALDDYEEGTFTPALSISGDASGFGYAVQVGEYVKIGKLVTANVNIQLSSLGTATGSIQCNLPFSSDNTGNFTQVGVAILDNASTTAGAAGIQVGADSQTAALLTANTANNLAALQNTAQAANFRVRFSFTYKTQ